MKPLRTTKRVLIWLCMCPAAARSTKKKKIAHFIFAFVIFIIILAATIANSVASLKFMSIDMTESVFTFMGSFVNLGTIYALISAYRSRQNIHKILTNLSIIYGESRSFENLFTSTFDTQMHFVF